MSHEFPEDIFNDPELLILGADTPPWTAWTARMGITAHQPEHPEAIQELESRLEVANATNPLFATTLNQLYADIMWAHKKPIPTRSSDLFGLMGAAALTVWTAPHPGMADILLNVRESRYGQQPESGKAIEWLNEPEYWHSKSPKPTFEQELASLDPAIRQDARESVLQTLYGDRYEAYLLQKQRAEEI